MNAILHDPLCGITLTVGCYAAAQSLHRRWPHLHPFVLTITLLLLILWAISPAAGSFAASIQAYKIGGDFITFLLGPAVVALAIPLYKNARHIHRHLAPILAAHPKTRMRYYDTEAFSGRCSDIAVFETEDAQDYSDLVEDLRDTAFFAAPYYAVVDIIPGIENGYLDYDARTHTA